MLRIVLQGLDRDGDLLEGTERQGGDEEDLRDVDEDAAGGGRAGAKAFLLILSNKTLFLRLALLLLLSHLFPGTSFGWRGLFHQRRPPNSQPS